MKTSIRTCIICRKKGEKKSFHRIVCFDNTLSYDKSSKKPGRGAYICKDENCVNLLIKKKALNYSFKKNINYNELKFIDTLRENNIMNL